MPNAPQYLVLWLDELGWVLPGGMGAMPLTAAELHAWASLTGRHLQAWEVGALLSASRSYLAAVTEASLTPPDEQPMPKVTATGRERWVAQLNAAAGKT